PLKEVKFVLIVVRVSGVERPRSAEWSANHLTRETRRGHRLGAMKRDVGHGPRFEEARDCPDTEAANSQRRLVDARGVFRELLARTHVKEGSIAKEVRDPRIEDAHPRARGQKAGGDHSIAWRVERLLRPR